MFILHFLHALLWYYGLPLTFASTRITNKIQGSVEESGVKKNDKLDMAAKISIQYRISKNVVVQMHIFAIHCIFIICLLFWFYHLYVTLSLILLVYMA